jgi:hypothetical protein
MAAACASWSAGQHLASLGSLATKLDRLERQAELLDSWQEEREQVRTCRTTGKQEAQALRNDAAPSAAVPYTHCNPFWSSIMLMPVMLMPVMLMPVMKA